MIWKQENIVRQSFSMFQGFSTKSGIMAYYIKLETISHLPSMLCNLICINSYLL